MPALPGAHHICVTCGDCASFQTSACSRPPEPMTRIFIANAIEAGKREGGKEILSGRRLCIEPEPRRTPKRSARIPTLQTSRQRPGLRQSSAAFHLRHQTGTGIVRLCRNPRHPGLTHRSIDFRNEAPTLSLARHIKRCIIFAVRSDCGFCIADCCRSRNNSAGGSKLGRFFRTIITLSRARPASQKMPPLWARCCVCCT